MTDLVVWAAIVAAFAALGMWAVSLREWNRTLHMLYALRERVRALERVLGPEL